MLTKKQRRAPIGRRPDQEVFPRIGFLQGLDFAINAKRAEGLRDRTLKDYNKHFGYFFTWLTESYSEMQFIDELTPTIIRDHINYMRYDAKRYAKHKYINSEKQTIGLSDNYGQYSS